MQTKSCQLNFDFFFDYEYYNLHTFQYIKNILNRRFGHRPLSMYHTMDCYFSSLYANMNNDSNNNKNKITNKNLNQNNDKNKNNNVNNNVIININNSNLSDEEIVEFKFNSW